MEKVIGVVIRGKQRGRTWNFPTANIKWKKLPEGIDQELYWGMTIVDNWLYHVVAWHVSGQLLECHLLGFNGDLYDRELEIVLIKKVPIPTPPDDRKRFKNREEKFAIFKETIKQQLQFN